MTMFSFTIYLFLLSGCAEYARRPAEVSSVSVQHIVFDIDWTMVAEITNPTKTQLQSSRVIVVDGHTYFINEGLEEFIENLNSLPDVRISFFSGGTLSRNNQLLEKIKLKDGRSLKQISYKVLGKEHLVAVPDAPSTAKFAERYKKDLTLISDDLEQVLMFDDTKDFVLESKASQKEQVFFTGTAFLPFESFQDVGTQKGDYIPKSYDEWLLDRKKLFIIHGAFKEAYADWKSGVNNSLLPRLMKEKEKQLNLASHQWNRYSRSLWKPAISPVSNKRCSQLIENFL